MAQVTCNKHLCLACTAKRREGYCMGFCGSTVDNNVCDTCTDCFDKPCDKCHRRNNEKFGPLCDDCAIPGLFSSTREYEVVCTGCQAVFTVGE